jgi:5-formyltetrahydrofolate cyclo-ligase
MTLLDDKADLRETALAARKMAAMAHSDAGDALAKHFPEEIWPAAGGVVASYRPIGSEINPASLEAIALNRGCRLALPVMRDDEDALDFRGWKPGDPLEIRGFNVPEPSLGADVLTPDLILMPLLAVDLAGRRLGYGKGYYDRTVERLRQAGRPVLAGLAYEVQRVERVPTEGHDQNLDWLITEARAIRFF